LSNSLLVTSTDSTVNESFPKVTGTTVGAKHLLDVAIVSGGGTAAPQAIRIDDATSTVTYIGKAEIATAAGTAAWQIQRITTSGTESIIEWADGDSDFNNIWSNRASLSYS
jgi:hypothetical protein